MLTPYPGVCSWGPCYLRILKGSKAQGNCKARVFPSAEEGKCSDRSGFLREGGASLAAIGTDCSPTDSGPEKKKKSLQLYLQSLLLFAAVCYNTAWQPPASFSLPPPSPRPCDMATRHSRFDHTVPAVPSVTRLFQVCILLAHAMPPLFHPAPPPRVSFLPLPHPSAWQTPSLNTLLRLRSSVTSSMRPSLTPFPRKSRLPCSWESTTGLCIATPYAGILSQSMKHEAHGHAMWMALSLRSGTMSSHLTIPCT